MFHRDEHFVNVETQLMHGRSYYATATSHEFTLGFWTALLSRLCGARRKFNAAAAACAAQLTEREGGGLRTAAAEGRTRTRSTTSSTTAGWQRGALPELHPHSLISLLSFFLPIRKRPRLESSISVTCCKREAARLQ